MTTTATPAAAWHALHIMKLPAKTSAKHLGVCTTEFWSLVAAHKIVLDERYDDRASRAPADDPEALDPAKKTDAENAAWRARRRAQLEKQGLPDVIINERLADTSNPGYDGRSRSMSAAWERKQAD